MTKPQLLDGFGGKLPDDVSPKYQGFTMFEEISFDIFWGDG
jgi:hypothetical protein